MVELKGLDSTEKLEVLIPLAREQFKGTNFPADALATAIHERNRSLPAQKMSEQLMAIATELKRLKDKYPEALDFLSAVLRKEPNRMQMLLEKPKELADALILVGDTAKTFAKTFFENLAKKEALNDLSDHVRYLFEASEEGLSQDDAKIFLARTTAINSAPHKAIADELTKKITELADKKYTLAEQYVETVPSPFCLAMVFAIETWEEPKLHDPRVDRVFIDSFVKRMERKEFTLDDILDKYEFKGPYFFSYAMRATVLGMDDHRKLDQKYIDNFRNRVLGYMRLASGEVINLVQRYRQIHDLWQKYSSNTTVSSEERDHFIEIMWKGVRGRQPELLHIVADLLSYPKIDVPVTLAHLLSFARLGEPMRLGLYFIYSEAKQIVKDAGLDSNDPINVLNFAYAYAVLGDKRKVLALNKRWGVVHFMSFSQTKIRAAYDTYNRMRSGQKLNSDAYVYMRAMEDDNNALYADRVKEPDPPKGVAVVIAESPTDIKWRNQIKDVGEHVGQIVFFNQNAHGKDNAGGFLLGNDKKLKDAAVVSSEDMEKLKLAELNKYFAKGAIVVLSSCNQGKGQLRGLAVALSGVWTNTRVFASTDVVTSVAYLSSTGESIAIPVFKSSNGKFSPTHLYEKGVVIAVFNENNGYAVRSKPVPIPGEVKVFKITTPIAVNLPIKRKRKRGPNA